MTKSNGHLKRSLERILHQAYYRTPAQATGCIETAVAAAANSAPAAMEPLYAKHVFEPVLRRLLLQGSRTGAELPHTSFAKTDIPVNKSRLRQQHSAIVNSVNRNGQSSFHFSLANASTHHRTFPPSQILTLRQLSSSTNNAGRETGGNNSRSSRQQESRLTAADEDVFDSITDKIPMKPVTVVEGASYSVAILAGLAVAVGAAYFVVRELLMEPKE